jgi:Rrf2 family transcriptional regulator, nitric oxide-sensitive transcriptional repressor
MQINTFTDYSLRVLMYATVHGDRLCTIDEIARAFDVSRHHLVKVVNALQHLGYLETQRGRTGGFRLSCEPDRTRLGDIVRRTEGTLALVECFDPPTNTCPLTRACGLKGALKEAVAAFFGALDRYTLADLVAEPRWLARVVAVTPPGGRTHA